MTPPTCTGCREREALLEDLRRQVARLQQQQAQLQQQVRDLQARLGQNATNSSLPPSANPPAAPKPVTKKATGRRPGGQPGQAGRRRKRLPPERLGHVIPLIPSHCARCNTPLPQQPGPDDPPPTWHQLAELPRVAAVVTEFQGHARTCPCCRHVTHEPIPAALTAHGFGPRLTAALSYLSGSQHVSKRGQEEVAEVLFGVPLSLGTVIALQEEVSATLARPHDEAVQAARRAEVKNVDETGWKQAGRKRWLWVAVAAGVMAFLIHRRRGAEGLRALLGEQPAGIIGSDRWSAYGIIPLERRQICWAHLRRDFQALIDRGGPGAAIGKELLFVCDVLFEQWHRARAGPPGGRVRRRRELRRTVEGWLRADVLLLLERGVACGCAKTAGTCAKMLEVEPALWTFVYQEGVEPTNNGAERAVRPAVLWRKRSFGCWSEAGCRFVERLLTVVQTLRLRGESVLDYLANAVDAHRHNLPIPNLLPAH